MLGLGRTPPRLPRGLQLLVVDPCYGVGLAEALEGSGVSATCCTCGGDALVSFGSLEPDVVLVAPDLPDVSVEDVVRTMRRFGTPPIFLGIGPGEASAAGPALMAGATGAVSRPYDVDEVVQRIRHELPSQAGRGRLAYGPLVLDPLAHTVWIGDTELPPLPLKEFALLGLLMRHPDQVVATDLIRRGLWSSEQMGSPNAVAVHVARLRSRLLPPVNVRTVRGLGYRLTLESDELPVSP